ncbi:hypothetical protein K438DRAFT_1749022 [Mycena galopus ATCC 62051]|nr:hypothetical protein K438DRAFT_1749022 [Mycena galopus ATCC 62051]
MFSFAAAVAAFYTSHSKHYCWAQGCACTSSPGFPGAENEMKHRAGAAGLAVRGAGDGWLALWGAGGLGRARSLAWGAGVARGSTSVSMMVDTLNIMSCGPNHSSILSSIALSSSITARDEGANQGVAAGDGAAHIVQGKIDELWARADRRKWMKELAHAYTTFERGRNWGMGWARCVAAFFDFEAVHSYTDGFGQLNVVLQPGLVYEWLARKRDWEREMTVGFLDGAGKTLDRPDIANWEDLAAMNGKNGLLLVMASLLWWGDRAGDEVETDAAAYAGWTKAVDDVTWTLDTLTKSGCIHVERAEKAGSKGTKRKRGKESADAEEGEEPRTVRRSTRRALPVKQEQQRQTRAQRATETKGRGRGCQRA